MLVMALHWLMAKGFNGWIRTGILHYIVAWPKSFTMCSSSSIACMMYTRALKEEAAVIKFSWISACPWSLLFRRWTAFQVGFQRHFTAIEHWCSPKWWLVSTNHEPRYLKMEQNCCCVYAFIVISCEACQKGYSLLKLSSNKFWLTLNTMLSTNIEIFSCLCLEYCIRSSIQWDDFSFSWKYRIEQWVDKRRSDQDL